MIATIICFILAALCLVVSILQFKEKGFCFNNAYLYVSKEEREKMDKSPHYRQSAIVFLLLFFNFVVEGVYSIIFAKWLLILEAIIMVIVVIYAIISSIKK